MTPEAIEAQFRSIINEASADNSHFTSAQAMEFANEAIRFIVTRLEELPISWPELTAATGDITISSDTLLINEAYILNPSNSKYDRLEIIDYGYLKYISPTWLSDSTDAPQYLARKGTFTVYLYPQPKATYVGQTIKTACVNFPTEISIATNTPPDIPKHTHDWIPHYMAYRAFEQLGMTDRSVSELIMVQGLIKSTKSITTKFNNDNEQWRITEDNDN